MHPKNQTCLRSFACPNMSDWHWVQNFSRSDMGLYSLRAKEFSTAIKLKTFLTEEFWFSTSKVGSPDIKKFLKYSFSIKHVSSPFLYISKIKSSIVWLPPYFWQAYNGRLFNYFNAFLYF